MHKNSDAPKQRLWRRILLIMTLLGVFYAALTTAIREIAQPQLFHPNQDEGAHAALMMRSNTEFIEIPTAHGELSGFIRKAGDSPAPLLLYFGGNRDNASHMIRYLADNRAATFRGWHLAMIDYPGYGLSTGRPSDASLKRMALAAYDALSSREDVTEIVVLGYSIGTGPANYVASKRGVSGLILMAPYAEGADLFNTVLDVFHGPLKLLVSYSMSSVTFAEDIAVRPLIFATEQDELVPYASAVRLSKAYPAGCEFVTVPGIRHGGFWHSGLVLNGIKAYLDAAAVNKQLPP